MIVGNIFMGERYICPEGPASLTNLETGEVCDMHFKERGAWSTPEKDIYFMTGSIKDANENERYTFEGKWTDKIVLTEVATGEKEITMKAPKLRPTSQDPKKIYGINMLGLQMNHISDELKAKLPPTDTRLRPDTRAWEAAELELATKEKERLENN